MKIPQTAVQKKRLRLLANLLDTVPPKHFKMNEWLQRNGDGAVPYSVEGASNLTVRAFGYAGCAMGWALTTPAIRGTAKHPSSVLDELGFSSDTFFEHDDAGTRLFGPERKVRPKTVAKDIRAYLKTGALPTAS